MDTHLSKFLEHRERLEYLCGILSERNRHQETYKDHPTKVDFPHKCCSNSCVCKRD
ncbi:unnamed protein product [Moneuplotes crassus]|uniref:Uncharacterized protein n=1 Tax=Euplotes crassus TaxID=5936 RepID=A0AAD1XET0_EUPCR|nr:unnamed protein product [Moneuplotes crassus]